MERRRSDGKKTEERKIIRRQRWRVEGKRLCAAERGRMSRAVVDSEAMHLCWPYRGKEKEKERGSPQLHAFMSGMRRISLVTGKTHRRNKSTAAIVADAGKFQSRRKSHY